MPRCFARQPAPCCRGDPPCRRCRRNWPAAGGRRSPGPGVDTPEPGQTHTSWWPARPAASTSAPTETQTTPLIYNTPCFHFCSDWNTNHTTYLQYPLLPPLLWLKHKPHHLFITPTASTSALTETETTPLIYNTPCFHFCSYWNTNHTTYLQYPLLPLLLRLKHKPHHLFSIPPASTSALTETQTTPLIYNTHCFHFCSDWNRNHTTYLQYPQLPLLLRLKHKPHHLFTIPPASTSALTETQTTPLIYNTHCFHFCSDWNRNHTTYLQYPLLPLLLRLKHKPHHLFTIPPASTSALTETQTTPLIYNTHCFHFCFDWNRNHTTYLQYPLLPLLLWLKHKPHHLFTIPPASTSAPTEAQTTPLIYNTPCFHFCFFCKSLTKIHHSLGRSVEIKQVPAYPWQRFIAAVTFI